MLGSALWGASITIFTMATITPPYYGIALNPIFNYPMNTPGVSNLLFLGTLVMLTVNSFGSIYATKSIKLFSVLVGIICVYLAIQLEQRTYFYLLFIAAPCIGFAMLLAKKRKYVSYIILPLLLPTCYFFMKWTIEYSLPGFSRIDLTLLSDLRFSLYLNWFEQFTNNPIDHPRVTYIPNVSHGPPTPWFHNYFMDAHRISGLWGLAPSVFFMLLLTYKLIKLLITNFNLGSTLIFLFIPLFLIINTSVFPDGEIQFLMLIYSIGTLAFIQPSNHPPFHSLPNHDKR